MRSTLSLDQGLPYMIYPRQAISLIYSAMMNEPRQDINPARYVLTIQGKPQGHRSLAPRREGFFRLGARYVDASSRSDLDIFDRDNPSFRSSTTGTPSRKDFSSGDRTTPEASPPRRRAVHIPFISPRHALASSTLSQGELRE